MLLHGEAAVRFRAGYIDDICPRQRLITQLERQICNAVLGDHIQPLFYPVVLRVLHPQERKKQLFQHLTDTHPIDIELQDFSAADYQAL